ncbi:hypothetical protein B4102_1934 [Heyndrickxia sporothermodurans]|uniref:Uncharacterized protein n=1 Tax=Heyndrickxia sporothermodurans TaxID=46224 RepID=A0A150LC42_9BACI|nr:hypothetical protein B4102_1934 [Heyndrickxia sporothermodurans]
MKKACNVTSKLKKNKVILFMIVSYPTALSSLQFGSFLVPKMVGVLAFLLNAPYPIPVK